MPIEWIGDFDFAALCLPVNPFTASTRKMRAFQRSERLPILVAAIMGLQHCFAMIGGLITPPFVVAKFSVNFGDVKLQQQFISAALIVSGICTIINCVQIPLGPKYKLGTGVLSVIGTSFTMLPIFETSIAMMKADGKTGEEAYGKMLGTVMLCSLLEIGLSFIPPQTLRRMFPPIVTGTCVMLIGTYLTGQGIKDFGGGVVCADVDWKNHIQLGGVEGSYARKNMFGFGPPNAMCNKPPDNNSTLKIPKVLPIPGRMIDGTNVCDGNGDVMLPFASTEYIGIGFSVLFMLVLIEVFGSPFAKNANVVIAVLFGYMVAGASQYEKGGEKFDYVIDQKIEDAEALTFLWVDTYDIGFYGPAVFPLLICFIVTTVETIGDIGAVYDASNIELNEEGEEELKKSVQGGLLSDGVCSFFASICMSMPNTTFSQNNGVIALTKCASRDAGIAAGIWLILFGILGKVAGVISAMPACVLGGMTTFCFVNVLVSGLRVVSQADLSSRRNRFILAIALGIGVGVTIVPHLFGDKRNSPYTNAFYPCTDCTEGEKGIRNGVVIFLSTPYCIGTVLALLLNLILPADLEVELKEVAPAPTEKVSEI